MLRTALIIAWGPTLCALMLPSAADADEVLFRYEGDVLPYDPAGGFALYDPCKDCVDSVQDGYYIVEWSQFGDQLNQSTYVTRDPQPQLPTLWVEWRFRSNTPLEPTEIGCDGRAAITYRGISDAVDLHGDAAFSFEGGDFMIGLPLNEFRTLRFQSFDGENYTYSIDGVVFNEDFDGKPGTGTSSVQFGGYGSCDRPFPGFISRNEWDFVRYGTLGEGEGLVSSEPAASLVDVDSYPFFRQFTVTFDKPAFVYVDDITVAVQGLGSPPAVEWVKRPDNSDANTIEIVLSDVLPLNATTTFTFNTGQCHS